MEDVCEDNSVPLQLLESMTADDQTQQESAAPAPPPPVYCQVRSCGLLLTGGKTYCIKKRTCTAHMTAESVLLDDDCTPHRFCQQCGKFEPLSKFDSTKRSCRARLAKRRSGTRALLQKKGCRDGNTAAAAAAAAPSTGQGATSCCTHSVPAASGATLDLGGAVGGLFSAEEQLMLMYGAAQQDSSSDKLFRLWSETSATAPQPSHAARTSPLGPCMVAPSMSDGGPAVAASAAAAAAAAVSAPQHAISAPLYVFGQQQQARQQSAAAAADALTACGGDQMGQAEVLMALQALDDPSDTLLRLHGSNTSGAGSTTGAAAGQLAAQAAAAAAAGVYAGGQAQQAEHTSCSIPLANLDLGPKRSTTALKVHFQAPGSPSSSAGGAPCKSAPLVGLSGAGLSHGNAMSAQRTHSAVTAAAMQQLHLQQQQQQAGMPRAGSRLKWLIQELQQELNVCGASQLEELNNEELGTLLCAALAPPGSTAAAAAANGCAGATAMPPASTAAATLEQQQQQALAMSAAMEDAAAASMFGLLSQPPAPQPVAAPSLTAGLLLNSRRPATPADGDLDFTKMQVAQLQHKVQQLQLQHKVQQLQLQLQLRRDIEGTNTALKCETPPPATVVDRAGSTSAAAAAAGAAAAAQAAAAEADNIYRSASSIPDTTCWTNGGGTSGLLHLSSLGRGMSSVESQLQLPAHLQSSSSIAAALAAGGASAQAAAVSAAMASPVGAAAWVGAGGGANTSAAGGAASMLNMLKQQQLQLQHQQQAVFNMQASAPMSANTAAAQFMALQNQLQMVEDEMLLLLARQQALAGGARP